MALDRNAVVSALPTYEVGGEIGRGGWGIVLSARHRILDRPVAVKQLPVAFGADPVVRARFKEEARLVAKLDHPHIAPVYDFVESDGLCLIVMEYLPGGTLWDRFQREGVRVEEACAYMLVAASALEHAHSRGMIHRDVKPENFLFDDRPGVIKLSDFGIAKVLGTAAASLTAAGQVMGTPAYMAPEQVLGKPVSPSTDVYACGTMLFELITGKLPFPEHPDPMQQLVAKVKQEPAKVRDYRPDLPVPLAAVIDRTLSADPSERYLTAEAFGEALAEAATPHLGVGWLRRSGVQLYGSGHIFGMTERDSGGTRREIAQDPVRATMTHARMGELLRAATNPPAGGAGPSVVAAGPGPGPGSAGTTPDRKWYDPATGGAPTGDPAPAATSPTSAATSPTSAAAGQPRSASLPPPGWFVDPTGRHDHRWWSGRSWTEHVSDGGVTGVDPMP